MAGVILWANILIILFCIPWHKNQSSDDLKTEFQIVSKLVNLEFNCSQFLSVNVSSIWRDVTAVFVITVFLCFIIYQVVLQWRAEKELDLFTERCRDANDRVIKISSFYRDIETRFSYIKSQSTSVHGRFKRAKKMIADVKVYDNIKVDFQTIRSNWFKELPFTSRFDADVLSGKRPISEQGTQVQLNMAKGFLDSELLKIRKDMSEDILSLDEVDKDVRLLQKYFDKNIYGANQKLKQDQRATVPQLRNMWNVLPAALSQIKKMANEAKTNSLVDDQF
ncbi:unnamed protein product [Mytilus coruscus]|uniref:Uncharacterized protein n=1 Tax=Mytilus coruscus TaxID=42192 RepID=A0A6J7ZUM5_MYTCO|nr:unnamed protein product [Mytilus coruscus]